MPIITSVVKILFNSILVSLFCIILLNLQCTKNEIPEQVVVVTVGENVITVDDFRYNYEFGLPHLKQGPDSKLSYLNYMINEQLFALEGYKKGLEHTERIQALEKELMDELLVEELFTKEVIEKIEITPEEINDAIKKSKVKWKLRYWIEPTRDDANRVCSAMKERGYADVASDILNSNPEVRMKPEDFKTDYLTWLDVSPELLDAFKDLPVGEISNPVEINGVFFIFQVIDICREPLSEYDFQKQAPTYRKILRARKSGKMAARFVSEFMTPENVVTKGEAFRILSKGMYEWYCNDYNSSRTLAQAMETEQNPESALVSLKENLNRTLVTFKNGHRTIKDFLDRFNERSIKIESPPDFRIYQNELNRHIALCIRNYFFTKEARKRGLHKTPPVQKQMKMWRDKWVYEELRNGYVNRLTLDDDRVREYFNKNKSKYKVDDNDNPLYETCSKQVKRDASIRYAHEILVHKADSLKMIYPVSINHAVLDTITVMDSKKSAWMSVQVYKRSSNRLARPIVDAMWGF